MKKLVLIITINLIILFSLLIFADWLFLAKEQYKVNLSYNENWRFVPRFENNLKFNKLKRPVMFMGCSYTFGFLLSDMGAVSYQLQKYSKRKTYNLGNGGGGIQNVLWQLDNIDFNSKNINPECIIYIFMNDHLRRMYANYTFLSQNDKCLQTYKKRNGKLIPLDIKITWDDYIKVTYLAKRFNNMLYMFKSDDSKFDLLKLYLTAIKTTINKKFPDTKFAVIVYKDIPKASIKEFHTNRWNEIEDMGIKVLNFDIEEYNFLTQNEYLAVDGIHPSAKAWEKLVPIITKELKL